MQASETVESAFFCGFESQAGERPGHMRAYGIDLWAMMPRDTLKEDVGIGCCRAGLYFAWERTEKSWQERRCAPVCDFWRKERILKRRWWARARGLCGIKACAACVLKTGTRWATKCIEERHKQDISGCTHLKFPVASLSLMQVVAKQKKNQNQFSWCFRYSGRRQDGRCFHSRHKRPLNSLMSMKMMWIICYGLHSHKISNQLDTYASRFWTTVTKTPNEGLSFGKNDVLSLQCSFQWSSILENLCRGALKLFSIRSKWLYVLKSQNQDQRVSNGPNES